MGIDGDSSRAPDYVVVGHVVRDMFGATARIGGSVLYAGATASRLGRRVGIVTAGDVSLKQEPALEEVSVAYTPSAGTTSFEVSQGRDGRSLRLLERAAVLTAHAVPVTWRRADIVHLAPIADEVALDTAGAFSGVTIVATPQGWLRSFSPEGLARPAPRRALDLPLESFAAMVLSLDDLDGDLDIAHEISLRVPSLVLTRGGDGCSVYRGGRAVDVPAFPVAAVDTIGAGDVFAAAFFVRRSETDDDVESARFASAAAALFVESSGVSRIPSRRAISDLLLGGSSCTE